MNIKEFASAYIQCFRQAAKLAADEEGIAIEIWVREKEKDTVYSDQNPLPRGNTPVLLGGGRPRGDELDAGDANLGLQSSVIVAKLPAAKKELDEFLLLELKGKLIPALERALAEGQDAERYQRPEVYIPKDPNQPEKFQAKLREVTIGHSDVLVEDRAFLANRREGALHTINAIIGVLSGREYPLNQYIKHITDIDPNEIRRLAIYVNRMLEAIEELREAKTVLAREVIPNITVREI